MIDQARMTYAALRAGRVPAELDVLRPCDDPRVLLGVDSELRPHLLAVGGADPGTSGVATLEIRTRRLIIDGVERDVLDIVCLFEAVVEVFEHFVAAVLERVRATDTDPSTAITDVLEAWQRFLTPSATPPGRDRLSAVFGELVMLADIVARDPQRRVGVWVGPHGGRHDLRRGPSAIEVKTSRAHHRSEVTIHGEDQLVPPDGGELFLHFVRVEEVPGAGSSVMTAVDRLLEMGVDTEQLFASLENAGIAPADLRATDEVRFDLRERFTLPVDDHMPRIVPEMFVAGGVPAGITDLTYRIDLDHVRERALSPESFEALVSRLAGTEGT